MKKVLFVTLLAIFIAATAYAQDAWYETAESSCVDYEVSATRQIANEGSTQPYDIIQNSETMAELDRAHNIDNSADIADTSGNMAPDSAVGVVSGA